VDHIQYIEAVRRGGQLLDLRLLPAEDPLAVGTLSQLVQILAPVPGVLLLASPLLLLWRRRRHVGVLFMVASILCWATITNFKAIEELLTFVSYSELITTPTRYVVHFAYWLIGLAVVGTAVLLDDEARRLYRWALDRPGLATPSTGDAGQNG